MILFQRSECLSLRGLFNCRSIFGINETLLSIIGFDVPGHHPASRLPGLPGVAVAVDVARKLEVPDVAGVNEAAGSQL